MPSKIQSQKIQETREAQFSDGIEVIDFHVLNKIRFSGRIERHTNALP